MIIDRMDRLDRYAALGSNYATACTFIRSQDIFHLPSGHLNIDGGRVYGVISEQRLTRRPPAFEAHARYSDLHIILSGAERFHVSQDDIPHGDAQRWENDSGLYRKLKAQAFVLLPGSSSFSSPSKCISPTALREGESRESW